MMNTTTTNADTLTLVRAALKAAEASVFAAQDLWEKCQNDGLYAPIALAALMSAHDFCNSAAELEWLVSA
jgi:hypothetical protein